MVLPTCEVWVAEVDDAVTAVLVLRDGWLDQLSVDPDGLQLWT